MHSSPLQLLVCRDCAASPSPPAINLKLCIHQNANLHPGGNWAFQSSVISCIRLSAIDGLQRGTRKPTWLTLTFRIKCGDCIQIQFCTPRIYTLGNLSALIWSKKPHIQQSSNCFRERKTLFFPFKTFQEVIRLLKQWKVEVEPGATGCAF